MLFRADSTFLSDVGTEQQRKELLDQVYKNKEEHPNAYATNIGCYRNSAIYENVQWLYDAVQTCTDNLITFYREEDQMLGSLPIKDVQFTYWTNINGPGSRNVIHSHKDADFACVYYLQGTDTGALRFANPANIEGDCRDTAPFVRDGYFYPKDGDIIVWPAWVPHEVEPNLSDRDRVNITFDIRVEYER